jgi:signal peptidase I
MTRMRRTLEILVGVAVCVIAVHTFALMGLIAPAQISAGSMAPHWLGPHWEISCGACGATYEVGADAPPQAGRTACPVCGEVVLVGDSPRENGDALVVDHTAFLFRSPSRWEPIVFRCPGDAKKLCLKRVIGLPGERVSLVGGDVYVNGLLVRKLMDEQRKLRVIVHEVGRDPSRWQSAAEPSSWSFRPGGSPSFEFDPNAAAHFADGLDLLAFTAPGGSPTTDVLPYNAGVPAVANRTSDLMLTGRFSVAGAGTLFIRCGDGDEALWVELDAAANVVRLRHADRILREAKCPQLADAKHCERTLALELSLFDRQIIVALDGSICLQDRLERAMTPAAKPFAIAATDLEVRVDDLCVWRDVVYTPSPGGSVTLDVEQAAWQLAADEYFVLGDNPAISDDSRTWPDGPGLPARLIVGRVFGSGR